MHSSPSSLQIFKSLGNVLDQCVSDWKRDTELPLDSFVAQVKKAILRMSAEYFSQARPKISFGDPFYRSAYLYKYAPANALAVEAVLNYDANHQRLISDLLTSKQRISMCCLGGGPGSEILGAAKWIVRQQLDATQLDVVITDKFPQWKDQWNSVRDTLNASFLADGAVSAERPPLVVSRGFVKVDVIDPASALLPVFRHGFDLYVVSYVVSHIYTSEGLSQFRRFMQSVIETAPQGSKFLFMDRGGEQRQDGGVYWQEAVRNLLSCPGIDISDPVRLTSDYPLDPREEKKDLGVLYEHLNISPRLGWDIFWVVGTKV